MKFCLNCFLIFHLESLLKRKDRIYLDLNYFQQVLSLLISLEDHIYGHHAYELQISFLIEMFEDRFLKIGVESLRHNQRAKAQIFEAALGLLLIRYERELGHLSSFLGM